MLTWVVMVGLTHALVTPELDVRLDRPADGKPCALLFSADATQLRGCGHTMEFWVNRARVGKPLDLGDMNVKGARLFQDGARLLWVVDVGDEGNSSLSFHALGQGKHAALGEVDWMVEGSDRASALPSMVPEVKGGVLSFTFSKPLVRLDGAGMPVSVKKPGIRVERSRIVKRP